MSSITLRAIAICSNLLSYRRKRLRPFFASYPITLRCNLRCVFCEGWKLKKSMELRTLEAKRVIDQLAAIGVRILGITGGEPLVRKDFEEIANYAQKKGIIVGVNTNGTLITWQRARAITRVCDMVFVSLDGFEKTHDKLRGQYGSFNRAVAGLKRLVAVKGRCAIGVNFVLNKENYREFIPFSRWLKSFNVPVTLAPVVGADRIRSSTTLSIPENKVDDFVHSLLREKQTNPLISPSEKVIKFFPLFIRGTMPKICDAGFLYLGVSPMGELKICPIVPNSQEWIVGSLLKSSGKELLESERFSDLLKARCLCEPCLAGCTTPYSLLARDSPLGIAKEAFAYYKCLGGKHVWN